MSSIGGLLSNAPRELHNAHDAAKDDPKKIQDAAGQFEALLISQMLRQVRESNSGGWMGEGEDQAGSNLLGLAEEQLAQVLASQGGLGLANMVARGLNVPQRAIDLDGNRPRSEQ